MLKITVNYEIIKETGVIPEYNSSKCSIPVRKQTNNNPFKSKSS